MPESVPCRRGNSRPPRSPCPRCRRLLCFLVTFAVLSLLVLSAIVAIVATEGRGSSSGPKPTTSPSAPPTSGPEPTSPASPDPTGTRCNIFDPECDSSTGGVA